MNLTIALFLSAPPYLGAFSFVCPFLLPINRFMSCLNVIPAWFCSLFIKCIYAPALQLCIFLPYPLPRSVTSSLKQLFDNPAHFTAAQNNVRACLNMAGSICRCTFCLLVHKLLRFLLHLLFIPGYFVSLSCCGKNTTIIIASPAVIS